MSLPRYPKYKDSGVEWLGDVPEHWDASRVRWLCQRYAGGTPDKAKTEYWENGTIPWLNSGSVNDRLITEPSALITDDAFANSSAKWIPRGALLMALAGQGKTKGMVAQLAFRATCNQSMAALVPGSQINARYLYYWLDSNYQNIRNMAGGDLRDGLNLELIGDIPCPLPAISEQAAIAAFLDRETAKIDALIAEQQRLIELLQEKRQAVISHAVTKGLNPDAKMKDSGNLWLGEMPAHWDAMRLKHVKADVKNAFVDGPFGSNLKSKHFIDNGDVYVIESGFATQGTLDAAELKTISMAHFKTINRSQARAGDIIIAKIGAQFGKASILPHLEKPSVVSGNSLKLTIRRDLCDIAFVHWYLVTLKVLGVIDDIVAGSAQPALSLGGMNNLPMLLPPRTEQESVVKFVTAQVGEVDALTAEVQQAITLLQERRYALISAAVTGQIDVRRLAGAEAA